ncbi:hypothetical protein SULPSESMR1_00490 [Pseudosulfitobacter pseudonitzschiae]|uniref:Uncharacterized protein n=1 Tax=Pseudosulfitobacter pseudonitzschiae TaxID=1402135 RepID=A0A221JX69_9RHOB|nr:hypothetical protein SULPSESMR1_00490 [Pseudosulfitobacter pseudonitzschiae]
MPVCTAPFGQRDDAASQRSKNSRTGSRIDVWSIIARSGLSATLLTWQCSFMDHRRHALAH